MERRCLKYFILRLSLQSFKSLCFILIYIYQDFGCRCVLVHEQIEVQGSNVDHSESYTLLTSVYIEQDERGLGLFVLLTVSFSRALSR